MPATEAPRPPHARKEPVIRRFHGIEIADDYGWLRADNWQQVLKDPSVLPAAIRAHLEAENAYTDAVLDGTKDLQEQLFNEMKGRIKEDDSSVPAPDGPFEYYAREIEGGQYPLYCRRPKGGGAELVYLDGNKEAEGHAYHQIHAVEHSPDHRLLAWSADTQGSGYATLAIQDLATGARIDEAIEDVAGGACWSRDCQHVFYVRYDDNHRPRWVYRHTLGTPVAADVVVYEELDPGFFVGLDKTQSGRFILIGSRDHVTSEVRLIDAEAPLAGPRLVAPRQPEVEYAVEHHGERLVILTNADAEDFKLVEAPLDTPGRDHWRDIVPHRPGCLVLDHMLFARHMVRLERENALPRVVVTRLDDGAEHVIDFAEEAYSLGLAAGYEFDTDNLRFTYSSPTTPAQVFDYDMASDRRVLRKTQEVPSGHDPADYVTRRLMAPAPDGETIPVTLLYRRTTPLDGTAPILLYGYGAYGISIPAGFSTNRLSLVDRGFIYAIAHIRGGEEKGRRWYLDGKLDKKTNTFSDFIAAARFLIAQGLTREGRIFAHGGSAGGMLMGVVANWAPELFGGIVAEVPFVDVLNTMLDDTLPLTPPEWLQWGNPLASRDDFQRIAGYSPYDNVAAKAYPPILAMSGIADSAVTYWEPAKWVAKLRETKTDDNWLLLHVNMGAGHGGASGRFDHLREVALAYAFAIALATSR